MIEDKYYKYLNAYHSSQEFFKQIFGKAYKKIPLSIRYGKVFRKYYELLGKSAYWDRSTINHYTLTQLNKILKIALNATKFYPNHYKSNHIKLESLKDLSSLPLISKDHLKQYKDDFLNRSISKKNLLYTTTGGTLGQPTELYWIKGRERSR